MYSKDLGVVYTENTYPSSTEAMNAADQDINDRLQYTDEEVVDMWLEWRQDADRNR